MPPVRRHRTWRYCPSRDQPVGRERRGRSAADYPPEEATPGGAEVASGGRSDELIDYLPSVYARVGESDTEALTQRCGVDRSCHRTAVEAV